MSKILPKASPYGIDGVINLNLDNRYNVTWNVHYTTNYLDSRISHRNTQENSRYQIFIEVHPIQTPGATALLARRGSFS
jgi:hypothetical protein